MRKTIAVLAAGLALCLTACSAANEFSGGERLSDSAKRTSDVSVTYNYPDGAEETPKAYNSYTASVANFAFKLTRAAYDGGDFAIAPMNSVLQLSLLADGAKDDAREEIFLTLGNELDIASLNTCSSYFKSRVNAIGKADDNLTAKLSGALLLNDKTDVRKAFLQTNADYFADDIFRFDFTGEHAQEKIDGAFGKDKLTLDKSASMLSYSAFSVNDNWLEEPEALGTLNGMSAYLGQYMPVSSEKAKGVVRYTANTPLKALYILPNEETGLHDYLKTLDSAEYFKLIEGLDVTKQVKAAIPCFETAAAGKLKEPLTKTGLYTLFTDKADFGNMAHTKGLQLSDMTDGTAPLYVNALGVYPEQPEADKTAKPLEGADIVFDKPFLFILADNETHLPLYIAAVNV